MKKANKENSARLVELGVELKDSCFLYYTNPTRNGFQDDFPNAVMTRDRFQQLPHLTEVCPAPTAGELGEVLPAFIGGHNLRIGKESFDRSWWVSYEYRSMSGERVVEKLFQEMTLADAMCLMLIWLLEQGHLTKEEAMKGAGR